MSDAAAAAAVQPASSTRDSQNAVPNQTLPTASELSAFHGYGVAWQQNVTGNCGGLPPNPTTPEILQWAALKWGMNPWLVYAVADLETGWQQWINGSATAGDNGGSHGIMQVPDRSTSSSPNHADPALANSDLAQESTCFNVDYWAARVYYVYNGQIPGQGATAHDVNAAIQSWYSGVSAAQDGGSYASSVCNNIANQSWSSLLN
ncbi:MAG: hypothetical protein JO166_00865 [Deltaproteobacteria bacterium]|nr:hypothetical protein [Deltaproteobacteria bacterium]